MSVLVSAIEHMMSTDDTPHVVLSTHYYQIIDMLAEAPKIVFHVSAYCNTYMWMDICAVDGCTHGT